MCRSTAVRSSRRTPGSATGVNPRGVSAERARSSNDLPVPATSDCALAGLVTERQHELAFDVAVVVVVLQVRGDDTESDEHDRPRRASARTESLRVELLPDGEMARRILARNDVQSVRGRVAERGGHQ